MSAAWAARCFALGSLIVVGSCGGAGRSPAGPAPSVQANVMTLMLDESWWLQVRRTGEHAIGFGALPTRIAVTDSAVDGARLLDIAARRSRPGTPASGAVPECRYTATFDGDGLVYGLPEDLCAILSQAFRSAWEGRDAEPTAERAEVIARAWRGAPFLRQPTRM